MWPGVDDMEPRSQDRHGFTTRLEGPPVGGPIDSQSHPEQEIDKVTTPSGCTIEGLNEMEHQGLSSSIIKGLVTSFEKINQI